MVAGLKPPSASGARRKKARIVACGNFQAKDSDLGARVDTQQVDATAVRLLLRWAAGFGHSLGSVDVTTAFLNARVNAFAALTRNDH